MSMAIIEQRLKFIKFYLCLESSLRSTINILLPEPWPEELL